MSLLALIKPNGPSGFGYGSTAEAVTRGLDLAGKTILVTGCNSGLGLETLRVLVLRGAHVFGTARTLAKAEAACRAVAGKTTPLACELTDPASVRACISAVKSNGLKLDAIICNAGIMALPKLELVSGYEKQFFTNHIGHFILVTGLLDALAPDGRVVVLSSALHTSAPPEGIAFDNLDGAKGYKPWTAYGQSKFANLLFAKELARRFAGSARTANAVHPGVIFDTNLARSAGIPGLVKPTLVGLGNLVALKTIPQGAATQCYVAVHPAAAGISGKYFGDCNIATSRPDGDDAALARRLWDVSQEISARV
jgi:NAD(P)-dependent dehydrogenase (short-subunit alcohol dehydrogenase family)